jgi:hypothetical protein
LEGIGAMSDPTTNGIHLTKDYYKDFLPTDLQWCVSKVDDDFTLYDLFRLVHHAEMMIPGISSTMGMSGFDAFWDQIQLDRDDDDDDDVDHPELSWSLGYDTRTTKKTGKHTDQSDSILLLDQNKNYWDEPKKADMSNLMSFGGIGPNCPMAKQDLHECGDDCPDETSYAVEFTSVNNLAHLPIRVLPSIETYPPFVESDRDFHKTGFKLTIEPTLWCFITSIFWELTFCGSNPSVISDKRDELVDRIKEIEDHMEEKDDEDDDPQFSN